MQKNAKLDYASMQMYAEMHNKKKKKTTRIPINTGFLVG